MNIKKIGFGILIAAAASSSPCWASETVFECKTKSLVDQSPVVATVSIENGLMSASVVYGKNPHTEKILKRVYYAEPITNPSQVLSMARGAQSMGTNIDPSKVIRYQEINLGGDTDLTSELILFYGAGSNQIGGNSDRPGQNLLGMWLSGYTSSGVCEQTP